MAKGTSVFGIYTSRTSAERGIERLRECGFQLEDISALLPENLGPKQMASVKTTKAPEGTATGATAGAVIGGTLGLLMGIGALAIPGVGPLLAAGPIVATLTGVGAGGAIGGITGALIGAGIPEYEAKHYEGRVRSGGILVAVHASDSDWIKRAKDTLKETGAEDVSSSAESAARGAKR